jgi:maltooligosyltrehalose trehalohydrolase
LRQRSTAASKLPTITARFTAPSRTGFGGTGCETSGIVTGTGTGTGAAAGWFAAGWLLDGAGAGACSPTRKSDIPLAGAPKRESTDPSPPDDSPKSESAVAVAAGDEAAAGAGGAAAAAAAAGVGAFDLGSMAVSARFTGAGCAVGAGDAAGYTRKAQRS